MLLTPQFLNFEQTNSGSIQRTVLLVKNNGNFPNYIGEKQIKVKKKLSIGKQKKENQPISKRLFYV